MLYRKNWLINPVTGSFEHVPADQLEQREFYWANYQPHPYKTVWDRDIVAAKCIMIKGTLVQVIDCICIFH